MKQTLIEEKVALIIGTILYDRKPFKVKEDLVRDMLRFTQIEAEAQTRIQVVEEIEELKKKYDKESYWWYGDDCGMDAMKTVLDDVIAIINKQKEEHGS